MYERLKGLKAEDYEHPGEKLSMAALRKIPLLDLVVAKYMDMSIKMDLAADCAGNNFRITPKTNPRIYKLYQLALERLDMEKEYPLYCELGYDYNAFAAGARENFIVIRSSCVSDYSDGEMLQLLGHEIGHIKSGHVLYHSIAYSLNGILASFGGIAQSAAVGLQYAIMDWSRKAEYTADRAGLIASADYDATMSQTMKLLGHSDHISCIDFSIDEVLKQAEDFEMETSDLIGKLLYANFTLMATHPWSILRLKQLYEWKNSGEYDAVVRAHSGEG